MRHGSVTGLTFAFFSGLVLLLVSAGDARAQIDVAGELFVDLDAADASAGTDIWENQGTLGDFLKIGDPIVETIAGAAAVHFNRDEFAQDAYQCEEPAPEGLVGPDPTRSIEVWVYNEEVHPNEETLVAWGHRGGPGGTNMTFNYAKNGSYGAVGHWGIADLGWKDEGGAPAAGQWHHLVYTYDGTTTRVYADGEEWNSENLGEGAINTHPDTPITLAAQIANDGLTVDFTSGNNGTLAIGRVRVHDGVLTLEQIQNNYNLERDTFPIQVIPPSFTAPTTDDIYVSGETEYSRQVTVEGFPPPALEVVTPADGTITESGLFSLAIPDPEPDSFTVTVKATNEGGTDEVTWTVTKQDLPPEGQIAVAGELFVDLDADDAPSDDSDWENRGTLDDFMKIGEPLVTIIDGAPAVSFNEFLPGDAYQCIEVAPDGLVGPDPTRSIEVWVYNESVAPGEETMVAWGHRGGPEGTNMAFNYAENPLWGAVGHWGNPDLGWRDAGGAPAAGRWHHLAYTFDGATTRVYADGELWNSEDVGAGVINTYPDMPITLAAQMADATGTLEFALGNHGVLALSRVRVHDGVLRPAQIQHNYLTERSDFLPDEPPVFVDAPVEDSITTGTATYARAVDVMGFPDPEIEVVSPAGATYSVEGVVTYDLPDPEPDSFVVTLRAANTVDTVEASWVVTVLRPAKLADGPVHRYSFSQDARDSVGGADGIAYGEVAFADGQAALNNTGAELSNGAGLFPDPLDPQKAPPGAYIDLPNGILTDLGTSQVTFEAWVTWAGPSTSNWQRIFDFGTSNGGEDTSDLGDASNYLFLTPRSSFNTMRFGYRKAGFPTIERTIDTDIMTRDEEQHVAVVWDDGESTAVMYLNGREVARDTEKHLLLSEIIDDNNWLGRSQWADAMFNGTYNEFRIYDYALSPEEVLGNLGAGPDTVNIEGGGGPEFRRGDANADGTLNITDGIFVLNFLFLGGPAPACAESANANDDGDTNITDGIYVLNFLFLGGPTPPAPGPDSCGTDPAGSPSDMGCATYDSC